jgi:PPM family protein phosphatase
MLSGVKLRCGGGTHPGRVRSNNEDRFHANADHGIFIVVDGVGGQAAGEEAASIALDRMRSRLERQTGAPAERMREAVALANNDIFRFAQAHPDFAGMACVLTAVSFDGDGAIVGHVGDSRLYKIRHGRIEKLTRDHSPIGEREDRQALSELAAMRHPRRNEVYRDVGSEEHSPDDADFIDVSRIEVEADCALLLCTDGLTDQVPSAEILDVVQRHAGNPQAAVDELIAAANRAGGKDNVTAIVVEGPLFAAREPAPPLRREPRKLASRWAFAAYGLAAGLLVMALWQRGAIPDQTPSAPPSRVLVAGSGPGAQFAGVAEALDASRPGDTVELLAGEYREHVSMREGVSIKSRTPYTAIIRADPAASETSAISASNLKSARIEGLRILSGDGLPLATGILIDSSDIEIVDTQISGAAVGIEIRGSSRPVLRANSVESLRAGIVISGESAPWISHNRIQAASPHPDLLVSRPARPFLIGNHFSKPRASAIVMAPDTELDSMLKLNFFSQGGRPRP